MAAHFATFTKNHLIVPLKWVKLWSINDDSVKSFFNASWRSRGGISCPRGSWLRGEGQSSRAELSLGGNSPGNILPAQEAPLCKRRV